MNMSAAPAVSDEAPTQKRKPTILWSGMAAFGAGMAIRELSDDNLLGAGMMLAGSEMLMKMAGDDGLISRAQFRLGVSAVAFGSAVANYMAGNPLGALNGAAVGIVYGVRSLAAALHRGGAAPAPSVPESTAPAHQPHRPKI